MRLLQYGLIPFAIIREREKRVAAYIPTSTASINSVMALMREARSELMMSPDATDHCGGTENGRMMQLPLASPGGLL